MTTPMVTPADGVLLINQRDHSSLVRDVYVATSDKALHGSIPCASQRSTVGHASVPVISWPWPFSLTHSSAISTRRVARSHSIPLRITPVTDRFNGRLCAPLCVFWQQLQNRDA